LTTPTWRVPGTPGRSAKVLVKALALGYDALSPSEHDLALFRQATESLATPYDGNPRFKLELLVLHLTVDRAVYHPPPHLFRKSVMPNWLAGQIDRTRTGLHQRNGNSQETAAPRPLLPTANRAASALCYSVPGTGFG
jgi:hypothetical protein